MVINVGPKDALVSRVILTPGYMTWLLVKMDFRDAAFDVIYGLNASTSTRLGMQIATPDSKC